MHYVPGVSSTGLTTEGQCFAYCAANSPTNGAWTFQTYSYGPNSCICKFGATTIYPYFQSAPLMVENLVGNCARYAGNCKW